MRTHTGKNVSATIVFAIILSMVFPFTSIGSRQVLAETISEEQTETTSVSNRTIYSDYLAQHSDAPVPETSIEVDIFKMNDSKNAEILEDVEGSPALLSGEDGYIEWVVDVPEAGFYSLYIEYFPTKSRGIDIERGIKINGATPFLGADNITLSRVWTDGAPIKQDNRGNDIRPSQTEAPRWESTYFTDSLGYVSEPYRFYFEKGVNTLTLSSMNEPVAIRRLSMENTKELPSYDEMIAATDLNAYTGAPVGYVGITQGESAEFRSSPTLYPTYDRSSPGTDPYSVDKTLLNMIGGTQWKVPGQWIEWEIDIPADGMYNISFKSRQNYNRGAVSVRQFTIDGQTPFQEVSEITFNFSSDWEMKTLCDANGDEYLFPLKQGKHVVRLEVTLGPMGAFLSTTEQSVNRLTAAYRKILVLVSTTPDANRDYNVDKVYPEVMIAFEDEIKVLDKLLADVTEYTGQKSGSIAAAQTLSKQLTRFLENPDIIPKSMLGFKTNIGAMAAFILRMSEAPLDIDYVVVNAADSELPDTNTGIIARLVHEARSFMASFYVNYSSIGNVYDGTAEPIEVWMLSGRDQAQSLKAIIDESFTPDYGISVNIRLVAANVLLPAVVAGTGPDVALQVGGGEPVNFALRKSAFDISTMPDFDEVKKEFYPSSFVPFEFDGGTYALPETQGFPMLFYREDILQDLGLEIPNTWEDVIKILPILQKNNMDFGMATDDLMSMYGAFLNQMYQRGGTVYNQDRSATLLDVNTSVDAFEFLTTLYTHYKLPKIYVFPDRFRTGEMPLGIADYTLFNQLSISAPEIRGLWNFTLIPGTEDENGNIDRSSTGGGVCSMLLPAAEDKESAWTFLKWWISADTQVSFGRDLESLIGASARYSTANIVAFEQLSWSSEQRNMINEQWQWVVGTPEVPGGYYTGRHTLNALRKVMNNEGEARETLLDYTRLINDELHKKRIEFGLAD